ncbi:MAG: hypothetical protein DRH17_05405 [Deltaproteobacteria bacterium]|nr:MAG: hypothetical protein DRH17_05405 [Deltaproteobacteria bacterium]
MERFALWLQHTSNPLHLYCRLIDMGLSRPFSMTLSRNYERLVYSWLRPLTTSFFGVCRFLR